MTQNLKYYLNFAEGLIKKYGPSIMIDDEDAIAFIAHHLMKAEIAFNGKGTKNLWMAYCGRLKIKTWIGMKKRESKRNRQCSIHDIDLYGNEYANHHASTTDVVEDIIQLEDLTRVKNCLSSREWFILHSRFIENMKLREISNSVGVSNERVRQIIKTALKKARKKLINEMD